MTRRIILIVGAVVIALMGLFPPWRYTFDRQAMERPSIPAAHAERFAGYALLWRPPEPGDPPALARMFGVSVPPSHQPERWVSLQFFSVRLDTTRIAIQMVAATLFFGFLAFAARPK